MSMDLKTLDQMTDQRDHDNVAHMGDYRMKRRLAGQSRGDGMRQDQIDRLAAIIANASSFHGSGMTSPEINAAFAEARKRVFVHSAP